MSAVIYRKFLLFANPIFLITTLSIQSLVLFLIIKHSPKSLHIFRILLACGCLFQVLLAFAACFNQVRIVTTRTPMEIWSYGLCRSQEPWVCYSVYQLEQLSALASGLTVYATFFLKYKVVTGYEISKVYIIKVYAKFYSPFIFSCILVVYIMKTQVFAWATQEQLRLVNTYINIGTDYLTVAFLSFNRLPNTLNLIIFSACIFVIPIISLYGRKRTIRQINRRSGNMSAPRVTMYRNFVMGLSIQCVLPFIFYIPIYCLYYYCLFTKQEVLFLEFFMTVIPALPAFVDPLISMYFVTPYRKRLQFWLKKNREDSRITHAITL